MIERKHLQFVFEALSLTSAGYSRALGRAVALGYARGDAPLGDAALLSARYEVDVAGERYSVTPRIV